MNSEISKPILMLIRKGNVKWTDLIISTRFSSLTVTIVIIHKWCTLLHSTRCFFEIESVRFLVEAEPTARYNPKYHFENLESFHSAFIKFKNATENTYDEEFCDDRTKGGGCCPCCVPKLSAPFE